MKINSTVNIDLISLRSLVKIKTESQERFVLDPIRKKWIKLQPEELVRQLFVQWLLHHTPVNKNLIQVEKRIKIGSVTRRFDILIYDKNIQPFAIIECKSPNIMIDQSTFDQISQYNYILKAPYLIVTNGNEHYISKNNIEDRVFTFLDQLPEWLLM